MDDLYGSDCSGPMSDPEPGTHTNFLFTEVCNDINRRRNVLFNFQ